MSVIYFGLKTLIRMIILIGITSCTVIVLIGYSPIDPVNEFLGGNLFSVSANQKANIALHLGTELTPLEQLTHIGSQLLSGNLGFSNYYQQPVLSVIKERVGYSARLLGASWVITFVLGYGLGLLAGIKKETLWGRGLQQVAWVLSCLPSFWVGIVLIALFSLQLHWLPVSGGISLQSDGNEWYDRLVHLVLPITTIVLSGIGPLILHTKEKVVDLMATEYVQYAQMHHLSLSKLVRVYVLPSSIVPAVILHFAAIAEMLGCSALIESVFSYPGLGSAFINSGLYQDGALLIVLSVFSALFIALSNLFANVIQQHVQPSSFQS